MARLCERPGCSSPAEVAYGFDAESLVVWLDGFHAAQGARSGVLCRRHADAMVVPLGWMLDDRRDPVPRLFRAPAEEPARPRARRARAERVPGVVQLELDVTEPLARPDLGTLDTDRLDTDGLDTDEPLATPVVPADGGLEPTREPDGDEPTAAAPGDEPEPAAAVTDVDPDVDAGPQTGSEPDPDPEAEADPDDDPADGPARPWQPVFDTSDDLSGLLKARGRLLSRAFNGVAANDD